MTARALGGLLAVLLIGGSAWGKPPRKKSGCAGGDVEACFTEGMKAFKADDHPLALKLLDQSCSGGHLRACGPFGVMHAEGRGVPVNLTKAYELFASACKARSPGGCVYEGRALLNGAGVKQDRALGLKQMQTGCELGEGEGCYLLGTVYDYGELGVEVDFAKAATWYQKAIDAKVVTGFFGLGTLYLEGRGVEVNYELALELLDRGCRNGEVRSCNNLASMHLKGLGTEKAPSKAIELYERACKAKEPVGCQNFALLLAAGKGRPGDKKAAQKYFRFACDKGLQMSCDELKQ